MAEIIVLYLWTFEAISENFNALGICTVAGLKCSNK